MLIRTIYFSLLFASVLSGPTGNRAPTICTSFCKDSTKLNFEPGTSYQYDYTTDISTSVLGGSHHESRLHLTANVEIYAATKCELILTLRNVAIEESDPDNIESRRAVEGTLTLVSELQERSLHFSFQDGKVEHICAPEEESAWVLNIKRGIISTLQNTMEGFTSQSTYEIDISGRCPTKYKVLGDSWTGTSTVERTKDLSGCSQRHSHISALQSIPYTSQSMMQSLPLLQGEQKCSQTIRNGKVEQVRCEEIHSFKPFKHEESGAKTVVTQSLVFSREYRRASPHNEENVSFRKRSLLYQNQGSAGSTEADMANIMNILTKLEAERIPSVKAQAPQHFIELVENLRLINVQTMKSLFNRISSPVGKKFLLDAMPLVSSAPSLTLMKDLVLDGSLTDKQIDTWLTSLIFIKHPSLDMIDAIKPLLTRSPKNQALLGISAMIHSYCKDHDECTDEEPVEDSLVKIMNYLGENCEVPEDAETTRRILYALKAIGNAGRLPTSPDSKYEKTLTMCFKTKRNPVEIRVAAIDAFRRMPCDLYNRQPIVRLYSDLTYPEDTEVRIKAYLTSMKCADRSLINIIKDVLYSDAVNQVSSFVWTHLTNLQETTSPDKHSIRDLLSNEFLQNKFKTDARKFSRNYENSYYNPEWNVGASSDANIIFTPDSFLPRSGMLNLTVHLFGSSINILEIGARVKALEQILEPIFGPEGYFPDQTVVDALHSMRAKRDTRNNEIQRLSTVYNEAGANHVGARSPVGSFYTRIFGHEMMYKNFEISNDNDSPSLVDENGKDWLDMDTLMGSLTQGNDIEYTKSTVLLDACYTVSTSAGIPLTLSLKSAATIGITAKGKIDLEKFWLEHEVDIQGLVRPSAAIEVEGTLSTQLGRASSPIKAGVRLQNTLHTSTNLQGKILMKGSKLVQATLNVPEEKQEIFTAKSELLLLNPSGKSLQKVEVFPKPEYKSCAGGNLLGVEFCLEVERPQQGYIPFVTPATFAIYLQKTDNFDAYELDYRFNNDHKETSVNLLFDTPGSTINRKVAANFLLDSNIGRLDASLQTPTKAFGIQGKYSSTEKSFQMTVTSMEEQVLLVNTGLNQHGGRLEPSIYVEFYQKPMLKLDGSIDLRNIQDENGRANVDLTIKHLTQQPIHITGDVNRSGEKLDTTIGVDSYILAGTIRSQFRFRPGHLSSKAVAEYSWQRGETRTIDISAKLQNTRKGSLSKFIAQFSFAVPDTPDTNFDFLLESQRSTGFFENTAKLTYAKNVWEGYTLYNNQHSREHQDLALQLSLSAPRQRVDYHAELTHKLNLSGMSTKFSGRTNPQNTVRAELEYLTEDAELAKKSLTAKASWPNNEYSLRAQLREVEVGHFEAEIILLPQGSEEMKAALTYKNQSSNVKLDHSVDFRARGFSVIPIFGNAAFSASDKQSHLGFQVDVNNKRWSSSLDYGVVKKNTHKLEGKLTLDEKKYVGEISYRKAKNGDRVMTVDLQGSRHIAVEAKLNGDWPGPFSTSLYYFPNKDTNPQSKMGIESTFDVRGIGAKINYYGSIIIASGTYVNSKFEAECRYGPQLKQIYKLEVEIPELGMSQSKITLSLQTPVQGYQNIQAALHHSFNLKNLDTKFQMSMEEFQLSGLLSGSHDREESRLLLTYDMTGIDMVKVYGRLLRKSKEKSLEIVYGKGERQTVLKAELTHITGGFSGQMLFKCCESMPELLFSIRHQLTSELNSNLKLEWKLPKSSHQQIQADLSGTITPLNVHFVLNTPWENFEKIESSAVLQHSGDERQLDLSLDGNFDLMPMGLSLRCRGNRNNFQYEIKPLWKSEGKQRFMTLKAEGHYHSLTHASIKTTLKLAQRQYELNWQAEKEDHTRKFVLGVEIERKPYEIGVIYGYKSDSNHLEMSGWMNRHNHPRISLELEHLSSASANKLHLQAKKGEGFIKAKVDLEGTDVFDYKFSSSFESTIENVPVIRITDSNLANGEKIEHHAQVAIGRMGGIQGVSSAFGNHEEFQTNADFTMGVTGEFQGALKIQSESISVTGKSLRLHDGRRIEAEVTSTQFSPVSGVIEYKVKSGGYEAYLKATSKGKNIFSVKVQGERQGSNGFSGSIDLDCALGHRMKGNVLLKDGHLEVKLVEDRAHWINFLLSAQVTPEKGNAKLEVSSKLFEFFHKKTTLTGHYDLSDGFQCSLKHGQHHFENALDISASWDKPTKSLQAKFSGYLTAELKAKLTKIDRLESSLTVYGDTIYDLLVTHSMDRTQEPAMMTFHNIKIRAKYSIMNPIDLTLKVGYGDKIQVEVGTPFQGWTHLAMTVQGSFNREEGGRKAIKITLEKESAQWTLDAEALINRRDGKISVVIETPWSDFGKMYGRVLYNQKGSYGGKIELGVDKQEIVAQGKFGASILELELKTPFDPVRDTALTLNWNLSGATSNLNLKAKWNSETYQALGSWSISQKKGNAQIKLEGFGNQYTTSFTYDFSQHYNAVLTMDTSGHHTKIGGLVTLNKQKITIQAFTPFKDYEYLQGEVSYHSKFSNHHSVTAKWDLKNSSVAGQVKFDVKLLRNKVQAEAETPIEGFEKVNVEVEYQLEGSQKRLAVKGKLGENSVPFQLLLETQVQGQILNFNDNQGASASVNIALELPLDQLQKMGLSASYNRGENVHVLKGKLSKNDQVISGEAEFKFPPSSNWEMELKAHGSAPDFGVREARISGKVKISSRSSIQLETRLNGEDHKMEGSFDISEPNSVQMEAKTTFEALKHLKLQANHDSFNQKIQVSGSYNGEQVGLNCEYNFGGIRNTKLNLEMTTPFEGLKSVQLISDLRLHRGSLHASVHFQNEKVRYVGTIEGTYSEQKLGYFSKQSDIKVTLKSPIVHYENIQVTFKHSLTSESGLELIVEKNSDKIINAKMTCANGEAQVALVSRLSSFPINTKNTVTWSTSPFAVSISIEAGPREYHGSLTANIQGLKFGDLSLTTSFWDGLKANWHVEGDLFSGKASGKLILGQVLEKSLRSSWKNGRQWESAKLDVWYKEAAEAREKGFSAQYSTVGKKSGNGKITAVLAYSLGHQENQQLTFTTGIKRTQTSVTADLSITTPYDLVQNATLHGKVISGESGDTSLDLTASLNDQVQLTTNAVVAVTTLASKLKFNFNAPALGEPFALNAGYDLTQMDKTLEISFSQGQYEISVGTTATVPRDSQEIELKMVVNSNVPLLQVSASGSIKAGYKIDSDGTRQILVWVDSDQTGKWEVTGAFRFLTDLHLRFHVDSPHHDLVPNILLEVNHRGNLRQGISSDAMVKIGKIPEMKVTLAASVDKVLLHFNSGFRGFEKMSLEVKLESAGTGLTHKKFQVNVQAMGEGVELEGMISIPDRKDVLTVEGSLELKSSWNRIQNGSLRLKVEEDGKTELRGEWGEQKLKVKGHLYGLNGSPWYKEVRSDLTLEIDGQEMYKIKSNHHFGNNVYSFNVTLGEEIHIKTYVQTDKEKIMAASVHWGEGQDVSVSAEAGQGRFSLSVASPWTSPMQANGQYSVTETEQSAKGYFTYDGERSSLEAQARTYRGHFDSFISVDIPTLHQKLDAEIKIKKVNEQQLQGSLDLRMNGRNLTLQGEYTEQELPAGKHVEKKLRLTMNLPSQRYPQISTDIKVQLPKSGFSNLQLETTIRLPSGESKAAFGYEIPINRSNQLGIRAMLDSRYVSDTPIEVVTSVDLEGAHKFDIRLQYESNDLRLGWDLTVPNVKINVFADIPEILPGHSPFQLEVTGQVNWPQMVQLKSQGSCKMYSYTAKWDFGQTENQLNTKMSLEIPALFDQEHGISLNFVKTGKGKYNMEASAFRGTKFVDLTSDIVLQPYDNLSVSTRFSGALGNHFGQVSGKKVGENWEFEVYGESEALLQGKRFKTTAQFLPQPNILQGFDVLIQCQTRGSTHKAKLSLALDSPWEGQVILNMESPRRNSISGKIQWKINSHSASGSIVLDGREHHEMSLTLNRKDLEALFHIQCPMMPGEEFHIHTKAILSDSDFEALADMKVNGLQWHLEGKARYDHVRNMEAKFELQTPFDDWDRITFAGKIGGEEIHVEIYTPFKNFPNAQLTLSGIPLFEEMTPATFRNLRPSVVVGLPWVTYTVAGTLETPRKGHQGEYCLSIEIGSPKNKNAQKYVMSLQVPSLEDLSWRMETPVRVHFLLKTPTMGLLRWNLGGRVQWKTWAELNAFGEFNGDKIQLVSEVRNEQGNKCLTIELTTPFKAFDNYKASIRLENYREIGSGRNIFLEWRQPNWSESIRLEVDYRLRFQGWANMDGEVKVVAPKFVTSDFPPLSLRMQSNVKDGVYTGEIQGSWGERKPSLKVEGGLTSDRAFAMIEAMTSPGDDYQGKIKFEMARSSSQAATLTLDVQAWNEQLLNVEGSLSEPSDSIQGQISLKTPFQIFQSFSMAMSFSPLANGRSLTFTKVINNLDTNFEVTFNDWKVIQLQLVSLRGKRSLTIHNPIHPLAVTFAYERIPGQKLRLQAEVCTDLNQAAKNTVGMELALSRTSSSKNALVRIQAGSTGGIQLAISHLLTSVKLDQTVQVKIFDPVNIEQVQEWGYDLTISDSSTSSMQKYDLRTRLRSPWRTMQMDGNHHTSTKQIYRFVDLKWDVTRDLNKRLGVKSITEVGSWAPGWGNKKIEDTVTIMHPLMANNIVVVLTRSLRHSYLRAMEMSYQATPFPEDKLSVVMSRNEGYQFTLSHPASLVYLDVQAKKTGSLCALGVQYMDIGGEIRALQTTYSRDLQAKLLEIRTGKDFTHPILRVQLEQEPGKKVFSWRSAPLNLEMNLYKDKPYMDMAMEYDSGRKLFVTGGLPHTKEISVRMWREEYGLNIQDVLVALRLNASQALSSKVMWRPEMIGEIEDVVLSTISATKNVVSTVVNGVTTKVVQEVTGRWDMLSPGLKEILGSFWEFSGRELEAVRLEVVKMGKMLQKMLDSNWFFVRTVYNWVAPVLNDAYQICVSTAEYVGKVILDMTANIINASAQIVQLLLDCAGRLEEILMPWWNSAEEAVIQWYKSIFRGLVDYFQSWGETYDIAVELLEGKFEQLEKKAMGISWVKSMVRIYRDYATWIEELPMKDYLDELVKLLKEKIWKPLETYYQPYLEALSNTMEERNLGAILEMPPFPYIRHVAVKFAAACNSLWTFVEAEQKVKELFTKAIQALDSLIRRNIPSPELIWEIEKGQIEYHQPLAFLDWDDFMSLPRWKDTEENQKEISKMNDFYYQVLDTFRNAKPAMDMDIRNMLPPFGAHAVMAGDHHYFTFDRKYFKFAGDCSYVLVADLLRRNFSLIVNYENRDGEARKKSYSLVTGKHTIDIDTSSLKVTLDGRKSELPLEMGPTFIRRMPNGLEIFDTRGFTMMCNQNPAVCTVTLSGWYFGKVAGLLGTYDNEETNDMKAPNGEIMKDVASFAYSWRVGSNHGECRMKNLAKDRGEVSDADGVCGEHFDDHNSLLRPCFGKVDTQVFKDMCLYDTSRNLNKASRQESACNAISAYVAECQKSGVDIWVPPTCVRCKLEDGTTLMSGENATLETQGEVQPPKSSDVVILLEEASCLSEYSFSEIVRKLDLALKAEGLNDNRFATIGFAGKGPHQKPHIRTSSGQIWAHSTLFRVADTIKMNGDGNGDLYEAIEFAARTLKFRAGVSKTFVAITCGDDKCGSERRYPDTLTLLIENDIKLHMLTPKEFLTKGHKQSMNSKIYGIDAEGVFTTSHLKRTLVEADKSMKRHVSVPKDLCTPLAIETNGTRFHLPRNSKKTLEIWSRRVAHTAQPSGCQHCECIPDKSGSPHVVCNRCISPMLEKMMLEWQKYQSFDGTTDEIPIEMLEMGQMGIF